MASSGAYSDITFPGLNSAPVQGLLALQCLHGSGHWNQKSSLHLTNSACKTASAPSPIKTASASSPPKTFLLPPLPCEHRRQPSFLPCCPAKVAHTTPRELLLPSELLIIKVAHTTPSESPQPPSQPKSSISLLN